MSAASRMSFAETLFLRKNPELPAPLMTVPGGAIVDSPISFGKSKLVGELLESPATVRKTASPEGGRLAAAPPRRTKPKNRLREKMTQAREEKFLQEW